MLENPDTLQFILDTVQKIGGAPHNLDTVQEEALDPGVLTKLMVVGEICLAI